MPITHQKDNISPQTMIPTLEISVKQATTHCLVPSLVGLVRLGLTWQAREELLVTPVLLEPLLRFQVR